MTMKSYLSEICEFLRNWKLKINVSKCESIYLFVGDVGDDLNDRTRKEAIETDLRISGQKVKQVKLLELLVSSTCEHVKPIINKVNAAQALLYASPMELLRRKDWSFLMKYLFLSKGTMSSL